MTKVQPIAHEDRTARMPHVCMACGHTIKPGQIYTRSFYYVDGKQRVDMYHKARKEGDECTWRKK